MNARFHYPFADRPLYSERVVACIRAIWHWVWHIQAVGAVQSHHAVKDSI